MLKIPSDVLLVTVAYWLVVNDYRIWSHAQRPTSKNDLSYESSEFIYSMTNFTDNLGDLGRLSEVVLEPAATCRTASALPLDQEKPASAYFVGSSLPNDLNKMAPACFTDSALSLDIEKPPSAYFVGSSLQIDLNTMAPACFTASALPLDLLEPTPACFTAPILTQCEIF